LSFVAAIDCSCTDSRDIWYCGRSKYLAS
jgi:hypothetical protein